MPKNDIRSSYVGLCGARMMGPLLVYHSSTQRTAPQIKINLTLMQYRTVVVCADTVFRALQLTERNTAAVDYERSFKIMTLSLCRLVTKIWKDITTTQNKVH